MAKAKTKSKNSKNFNLKSPKNGLLLFALIFAIFGGIYLVYRGFALTSTQEKSRNFDTSDNVATPIIAARRNFICVNSNAMSSYRDPIRGYQRYYYLLEQYNSGKYYPLAVSDEQQANGNTDELCFTAPYVQADRAYRVRMLGHSGTIWGKVTIYNYNKSWEVNQKPVNQ